MRRSLRSGDRHAKLRSADTQFSTMQMSSSVVAILKFDMIFVIRSERLFCDDLTAPEPPRSLPRSLPPPLALAALAAHGDFKTGEPSFVGVCAERGVRLGEPSTSSTAQNFEMNAVKPLGLGDLPGPPDENGDRDGDPEDGDPGDLGDDPELRTQELIPLPLLADRAADCSDFHLPMFEYRAADFEMAQSRDSTPLNSATDAAPFSLCATNLNVSTPIAQVLCSSSAYTASRATIP
mmetsp:Transcript_178619/g.572579  ORF Transcript_178619/g.572579 Transcript_178619/m.572579 type:complete len:236 (-) Transcript_178619:40-747(-)